VLAWDRFQDCLDQSAMINCQFDDRGGRTSELAGEFGLRSRARIKVYQCTPSLLAMDRQVKALWFMSFRRSITDRPLVGHRLLSFFSSDQLFWSPCVRSTSALCRAMQSQFHICSVSFQEHARTHSLPTC
jgi:hypothetical protein